ncbi:hypothetical protein DM01DRAFT_1370792 [Hesseltinella vesiculosa]|uniref:Uncharacterized protein n=1 Tax=Hesseltinella vesiculosa TaxID=101127 RepID=A0A1X2GUW3_9FUNG|nr:hypothetical protein DM01DRAFT_1370792 [Hesseltinella vesiculosa]
MSSQFERRTLTLIPGHCRSAIVLFFRQYWRIVLELERLARSTTPLITPPPVPALLDAAPASSPSPLATVGEVSENFASDFALGLCAMAAVLACYVLLWGVVRLDLFGQIHKGAVRIARHIRNVAVRFARCVLAITPDAVHLAHQLVLAADLLVSKLYDVVLVCLSAVLWSALLLLGSTLILLVSAIASTLIAACSLSLIMYAIYLFATGTRTRRHQYAPLDFGVEYQNVDLGTRSAKNEFVIRCINNAKLIHHSKVLTTTNEDTFGLGTNLLVDNKVPNTASEDTFGLGTNLLVVNKAPIAKNEDSIGLESNLLVVKKASTRGVPASDSAEAVISSPVPSADAATVAPAASAVAVISSSAPSVDAATVAPAASADVPVVVFCPPSRPRSKLVAWPNKHYGHRHQPYVLERQLRFIFVSQHRRHRRRHARHMALDRAFGLLPVRRVGVPVPWCWATEADAGVPVPVPVASPEPMLVDQAAIVPAASPEPMLVDEPALAPAAVVQARSVVVPVEPMLVDDTAPTAAPVKRAAGTGDVPAGPAQCLPTCTVASDNAPAPIVRSRLADVVSPAVAGGVRRSSAAEALVALAGGARVRSVVRPAASAAPAPSVRVSAAPGVSAAPVSLLLRLPLCVCLLLPVSLLLLLLLCVSAEALLALAGGGRVSSSARPAGRGAVAPGVSAASPAVAAALPRRPVRTSIPPPARTAIRPAVRASAPPVVRTAAPPPADVRCTSAAEALLGLAGGGRVSSSARPAVAPAVPALAAGTAAAAARIVGVQLNSGPGDDEDDPPRRRVASGDVLAKRDIKPLRHRIKPVFVPSAPGLPADWP